MNAPKVSRCAYRIGPVIWWEELDETPHILIESEVNGLQARDILVDTGTDKVHCSGA